LCWATQAYERGFKRGGNWNNGTNAGAFTLNLNNAPTNTNTNIGFRVARSFRLRRKLGLVVSGRRSGSGLRLLPAGKKISRLRCPGLCAFAGKLNMKAGTHARGLRVWAAGVGRGAYE